MTIAMENVQFIKALKDDYYKSNATSKIIEEISSIKILEPVFWRRDEHGTYLQYSIICWRKKEKMPIQLIYRHYEENDRPKLTYIYVEDYQEIIDVNQTQTIEAFEDRIYQLAKLKIELMQVPKKPNICKNCNYIFDIKMETCPQCLTNINQKESMVRISILERIKIKKADQFGPLFM